MSTSRMRRKKLPKIVSNSRQFKHLGIGDLWVFMTSSMHGFFIATCIFAPELGFSNTRIGAVEGFALVVSTLAESLAVSCQIC